MISHLKKGLVLWAIYLALGIIFTCFYDKQAIPTWVSVLTIFGYIAPYKFTSRCPLAVMESCIRTRSLRPWIISYRHPILVLIMTLFGLSDYLYLLICG